MGNYKILEEESASDKLGLSKFAKIKKEIRENPDEAPRSLRDLWFLLVGEDGHGGAKGVLENVLGYRYSERAIRERNMRLEIIRNELDQDVDLKGIKLVTDLMEIAEQISEENDYYRTFIFGDERTAGLFDQEYPDGNRKNGILREVFDVTLQVSAFKDALETLDDAMGEIDAGLVSFKELTESETKKVNELASKYRTAEMEFEQSRERNRKVVQELEQTMLDLKSAKTDANSLRETIRDMVLAARQGDIEKVGSMAEIADKVVTQEPDDEEPAPKKKGRL